MKYGFFGAGNMGSAIINGMIVKGFAKPEDIYVYDKSQTTSAQLSEKLGVIYCNDIKTLAEKAETFILAVKPINFRELLSQLNPLLKDRNPLFVSIAAGISISDIETMLGFQTPVIRVAPNINAAVGASMSAVAGNSLAGSEDIELVKQLFLSIGGVTEVPEAHFPIFSAIAGCSPAYAFMFIDSLAMGALRAGMSKKQAVEIAAQALLGSAKMVLESDSHPLELADRVCSPGGTTIEGVYALRENKFEQTVAHAVEMTIKKELSLSK